MWCTRWYLPLVLLPWPVAPPYFLLLFIFSTTLHAKPCFYCIVLLSALFMSSCYWPPVPIDSALAIPWSENITTFSDALLSVMPDLATDERPEMVPVADRCWCDFSSKDGLFEPYNVTQWELNSVMRLKEDLEKKREAATRRDKSADADENGHPMVVAPSASQVAPTSNPLLHKTWSLWEMVWPSSPAPDSVLNASLSRPPARHTAAVTYSPDRTPPHLESHGSSASPFSASAKSQRSRALFPGEYDLRPYGFGVVFDFGWSRNN